MNAFLNVVLCSCCLYGPERAISPDPKGFLCVHAAWPITGGRTYTVSRVRFKSYTQLLQSCCCLRKGDCVRACGNCLHSGCFVSWGTLVHPYLLRLKRLAEVLLRQERFAESLAEQNLKITSTSPFCRLSAEGSKGLAADRG